MKPLPTLSTNGWVTDIVALATRLMDYFLASEYSQSQFYYGEVSSLQYLIQQHGHDPQMLAQRTQLQLDRYLTRYFEQVRVNVDVDDQPASGAHYGLQIQADLSDGQRMHSLGRLIWVGENQILGVDDLGAS